MFKLQYMDKGIACLAQSPQLYKQMGVCCDLQKVFEVLPHGPPTTTLADNLLLLGLRCSHSQTLANDVPCWTCIVH